MSCSKLKRALAGDQSLWDEEEGFFAPHGGSRPSKQAKARVGGIRDRVQRAGLPTGPDCKEDLFDWPAFILSMVAKNPKRLERLIAIFVEGLRMASDYTGIDCPAEAERKRVVARKEQEEQSNKLREVREEAKKKAEEIKKKNAPTKKTLPVFGADRDGLPEAPVVEGVASPDWKAPFVWRTCEPLQLCLGDIALQKSFTSWANQYTKPSEVSGGRHQYPLQPKFGKEAPEQFFKSFNIPNVLDVSKVQGGAGMMQAVWLFGFDVDMKHCGYYPNNACLLRSHVLGEVSCLWIETSSAVKYVTENLGQDKAQLDLGLLMDKVGELDTDALKAWRDGGVKMMCHLCKAGDLVFVPAGWIAVEATQPEQKLVYGFRKTFFMSNQESINAYSAVRDLFQRAKRNTERMDEVLKKMKEASPAAPAAAS